MMTEDMAKRIAEMLLTMDRKFHALSTEDRQALINLANS